MLHVPVDPHSPTRSPSTHVVPDRPLRRPRPQGRRRSREQHRSSSSVTPSTTRSPRSSSRSTARSLLSSRASSGSKSPSRSRSYPPAPTRSASSPPPCSNSASPAPRPIRAVPRGPGRSGSKTAKNIITITADFWPRRRDSQIPGLRPFNKSTSHRHGRSQAFISTAETRLSGAGRNERPRSAVTS